MLANLQDSMDRMNLFKEETSFNSNTGNSIYIQGMDYKLKIEPETQSPNIFST